MELIKLLPDYYENNETMKTLQSILSEQTNGLDTEMYKTIDNCFAGSASDALTRYEHLLGLIPDAAKSDRYRRERIKAKISGAGTTTASLIQNIAESFTSAAVDIVENFPSYTITVRFTGTSGIPGNMSDIKQTIEEAVPAHLKVLYEYILIPMEQLELLAMQSWRHIPTKGFVAVILKIEFRNCRLTSTRNYHS